MKQKLIYTCIVISLLCNVIFMFVFLMDKINIGSEKTEVYEPIQLDPMADPVQRKALAEKAVRKLVCDNLYYPNTYDPVKTEVDSAFFCYLSDPECISAAVELIDLRKKYESTKYSYEQNDWTIRFHGNPSGPFLEKERKERAEDAKEMKALKIKIEKAESIIKNRDTSKDGKFIGWSVTHRYRAANGNDEVLFGNVLYVLDQQMNDGYLFRFSLDEKDDKNFEEIMKTMDELLKISNE